MVRRACVTLHTLIRGRWPGKAAIRRVRIGDILYTVFTGKCGVSFGVLQKEDNIRTADGIKVLHGGINSFGSQIYM